MRGIITAILAVVFLLSALVQVPVFANEQTARMKEKARRLYFGDGVTRNYEDALALYLQAAAQGDAEAQYIAGGMYFKGLGTEIDYAKAFSLLYSAAQNGKSTVESQKIIAQSFLLGQQVPRNYEEAVRWYNKAAEEGDTEAQNELGFMYFTGNGVEQDHFSAFKFFSEAAHNGHALAQYNLGIMYYTGEGVDQPDLARSYAWFSLAAAGGHAQAVQGRNFLESVLSTAEVRRGQQLAESLHSAVQRK